MKKRRILAITGTRADYGIYRPIAKAIAASEYLSLGFIVIGMHLRSEFGHTVDAINEDGFLIVSEIDSLDTEDTPEATVAYIGRTVIACADVLKKIRPDILLLLGDRGEQLAGAIAAASMGIPIAHLHGGESSGTIDDAFRHSITHMANLHFTSAQVHADAVVRMRGDDKGVFVVGASGLDTIRPLKPIPKDILFAQTTFDAALPLLIFVQHPDTLDPLPTHEQIACSLKALESFAGNILLLGANADPGGRQFNDMLHAFTSEGTHRTFCMSVPHETFLSWLSVADILVGNSSSGIIEAASFHLPVVNIGDRQRGRLQSGNAIDVPYDTARIEEAISRALTDETFKTKIRSIQNAYGDGHTADKIVAILSKTPL
ncbi:UDP-N-acetyl-D-glucosamine 2-epimerase, UDP-hydrolysing [Candidatus Peribacteria bacterium RIFCSPHIGHO2_02_FULL_53_20]|nr:MAG: UDP-N-acetyl-D-glucosamine 2-epimerase, UDP-hydrolysing [Candidatus Peribacteria bacterium RIFCSPHIGHO2_02_FULL_53_20]OGJ67234.1 MAG: UDP-N-acetyl-D-glucosamine 2-epimerase, UDP-hydrolysing [Candidatus Peribacteria bacterium RIFCSPLOWO2_01_FULL_53_10]OGJ70661.1 MAG: UDP-N-acetyl-D-glucosamine 2-epimerase, UDP-hydrolysing [Candidatus Peribacteria bacterium RIFCSPLOWO2_12_FULL_53_10]